MPTYYWYDDAIFNIGGGGGMMSSKGGKSSEHWGGSNGAKAGKSTEHVWWGSSYGGKARKMTENESEVVKEQGSGKQRRIMKAGKAHKEGLRVSVEAAGKASKEDEDVIEDVIVPLTDVSSEDDAVFFAYELQTAMPSGYHTVSAISDILNAPQLSGQLIFIAILLY